MENFKEFEIKNNENGYGYDYNLSVIQEENEKKFDILLEGLLNNKHINF